MLRVNKIKRDELTATDIYLSIYSQTLLIMVLYINIFLKTSRKQNIQCINK